jgi:hypothetical protein
MGSPMPMKTTLEMMRSALEGFPNSLFATQSWPMISGVVRLRLKPCLPVAQNEQSSTHPAWLETHSVARPVSGMNTDSTALAPSTFTSHLRVPSSAGVSPTICGASTQATCASFSRSATERSLMRAKSATPIW